jgi:hypothetical protein
LNKPASGHEYRINQSGGSISAGEPGGGKMHARRLKTMAATLARPLGVLLAVMSCGQSAARADETVCYQTGVVQFCGDPSLVGAHKLDNDFLARRHKPVSYCAATKGNLVQDGDPMLSIWQEAIRNPWGDENNESSRLDLALSFLNPLVLSATVAKICQTQESWFGINVKNYELEITNNGKEENIYQCIQRVNIDDIYDSLPELLQDKLSGARPFVESHLANLKTLPQSRLRGYLAGIDKINRVQNNATLLIDQFLYLALSSLRAELTRAERQKKLAAYKGQILIVPDLPGCSPAIHRESGYLYIPRSFYLLSDAERKAVVLHEFGHLMFELQLRPLLEEHVKELVLTAAMSDLFKHGFGAYRKWQDPFSRILAQHDLISSITPKKTVGALRVVLNGLMGAVSNLEPESSADLFALYSLRDSPNQRRTYLRTMRTYVHDMGEKRLELLNAFNELLNDGFAFDRMINELLSSLWDNFLSGNDLDGDFFKTTICDKYPNLPTFFSQLVNANLDHYWDRLAFHLRHFRNDVDGRYASVPRAARNEISATVFKASKEYVTDRNGFARLTENLTCN